jgi:hypothetical protein
MRTRPHLMIVALLLFATPLAAQVGLPPASNCGTGPAEAHLLDLTWAELPTSSMLATLPGSTVTLLLRSRASGPLDVRVELVSDAGGADKTTRRERPLVLAAGAAVPVTVDLAALRLPSGPMRFSGLVVAAARATPEDRGGRRANAVADGGAPRPPPEPTPDAPAGPGGGGRADVDEVVYAPALYFHRDAGGTWLAYGEQVLREQFRAGDLAGTASGHAPSATRLRVVAGGPGERGGIPRDELRVPTVDQEHGDAPASGPGGSPAAGDLPLASNARRVCIRWEIGLTDKGKKLQTGGGTWITEDWWSGYSTGGTGSVAALPSPNLTVVARGVRVRLVQAGFDETFDASPSTGCFTFTGSPGGDMTMTVYAYSTDADGNVVRIVDADEDTYSFVEAIEAPPLGMQRTWTVGDYSARATMAAVAAFATYRFHYALAGKEMRIRESATCGTAGANNSSAHFDASGLDDGIARVRIHDGSGTASDGSGACDASDHRRWKFLIGHEMGHAWLLLAIGRTTFEPNAVTTLQEPCSTCSSGSGYSIDSIEWNALSAREGAAHFYATEVWNSHDVGTAVFTWFGSPFDVEYNDPHAAGGRVGNTCDPPQPCGKATNLDWLRFWWDWHTPFVAGSKPNGARIRDVYVRAVNDHFDADLALTRENYDFRLRAAMEAVGTPAAQRADWDSFAAWNGVASNDDGQCPNPYPYPDCDCWSDRCAPIPAACRGAPDCPCRDVDLDTCPLSNPAAEGCAVDGPGSYPGNPSFPSDGGGLGQFCADNFSDEGAVCSLALHAGDGVPVCRTCPGAHGCPCFADTDCDPTGVTLAGNTVPLACWGSSDAGWMAGPGRCLPRITADDGQLQSPALQQERVEFERTAWLCKASCGAFEEATNFDYACWYNQFAERAFDYAACVDVFGCEDADTGQSLLPGICELGGRRCHPDSDICVAECDPLANGPDGDNPGCAFWGYPATYGCTTWTDPPRCVPAPCVPDPLGTGLDLSECGQFVLGRP